MSRISEEFGKRDLYASFWMVWKDRNDIVFRDEVLSIQRLKLFFVYLFWLETKMFFDDGPTIFV